MESCLRLRRASVARVRGWHSDAVPVARRLRDHNEAHILAAAIEDLMRYLRGDGEAGGRNEAVFCTVEFDGELTGENVEELRGVLVKVALFGGAGRHTLFDHAEGAGAMEVPAIAEDGADGAGPGVVFGIIAMDRFHFAGCSFDALQHVSC